MTSLVSPADVRALVNTGLSDVDLQAVINRVEAEITALIGAPQTDGLATEVTKTLRGEGDNLFLPTEIYSIVSIMEDDVLLDAEEYQTWGGGVIQRLTDGTLWGDRCVVTYKPTDDRSKRKSVIIDLVRLVLNQSGLKSENIADEYSYVSWDNWEREFHKAMKRLMFQAV